MSKLNILWVNDNPDTAHNMVFMYAVNSKIRGWWDEVDVIIWGASAKLAAHNIAIQERIKLAIDAGVKVVACLGCAANFGVVDELEALGIDVKYYGVELTEILNSDEKLITI